MARHLKYWARGVLPLLLVTAMPAAVLASESAASAVAEKPSATPRPLRCEPPIFGRDKLMMVCHIDSDEARRVRIRIHLTGSHDDTTASMEVAIGDTPVVCDADSKTSTESEDGDVTLDCHFTASGKAGAATMLRASARWFHAQYVGIEVDERQP